MARSTLSQRHSPAGESNGPIERERSGHPVMADAELQMSTMVTVGTLRNAAIDVARAAAETSRTASDIADALATIQQRLVDATARYERGPRRSAA